MNESDPISEQPKITDEQVVEDLRSGEGALFEVWVKQLEDEMNVIYHASGSGALARAQLEYAMRRATVYYRAGAADVAILELEDILEASDNAFFDDSDLGEQIRVLMEKMRNGGAL